MTPTQTYSRLRARLRDTHGFMLAEQLVSIIFIGLLSIAVAAGLTAALTAYSNITRQTNADNLLARAVESVSDELAYATDVEGEGDFPTFVSDTMHESVQFYPPESSETGFVEGILLASENAQITLVPKQNGFIPTLNKLNYTASTKTWTFHIQIWSGTNVLAETDMQVKRIGS